MLHGGKLQDPSPLVQRVADFLKEFREAQVQLVTSTSVSRVSKWRPPAANGFKLNFNVAIFQDIHASGFGAVIRNESGEVMASISTEGLVVFGSEEAEVLACRKAVEFAVDSGFYIVIIEGDNCFVMNAIISSSRMCTNLSRLGHLYEDIGCIISGLQDVSFSCVSHSANVVAHSLARFARSVEDEVVWLEDIPPPALQALYEDSNSIEIKIRSAFKKKKKKKKPCH